MLPYTQDPVQTLASSVDSGIASGMELGFHLLRRAGYDELFISEVARVMEYREAYDLYRGDLELATEAARLGV